MNTSKKTFALSSLTLRILTLGCFATAAFFGLRSTWSQPPQLLPTVTADSSSFVPSIQSPPSLETQNIEDIRLGQRVVGTNPLREQTQPASDINPATWRAVELVMHEAGIQYDLAFLRPLSWIETTGGVEGGTIHIELDEMGLNGPAQVTAINPCPEIAADDGTGRNVVTGTMAHPGPNILYLDITGLNEPLGVTDTHPIWSESRQDFVVAGQLEVGEKFRTLTGEFATLTKINPHRGPPEMVFNLEVDSEHVYSVAANGLLVHNTCKFYHGTDAGSAGDILTSGLDRKKMEAVMTAAEKIDGLGFHMSKLSDVADTYAHSAAGARKKLGAIIEADGDVLAPFIKERLDRPGEWYIPMDLFDQIPAGTFKLSPGSPFNPW